MTAPFDFAIRVSGLVKSYRPNQPNAVNGVSFDIEPGTVFGLLGPNGAGKTTTIKMILGLVLPTAGTVQLAGYDVGKERNKAIIHVGAVLEGSRNVYWRLSARANLEYFGSLRGMRGKHLAARIDEVLGVVGLSDRADEEVRYLSRGMQQKVALAAANVHNPDVLLLDEPTLGLDVQAAHTIEQVIRDFVHKEGKTVLLTTHQMDLAERLSDRIFVIHKGNMVAGGPTREVIARSGGVRESMEIILAGLPDQEDLGYLQTNYPGIALTQDGERVVLIWPDNGSQKEFLSLLDEIDTLGLQILHAGKRSATLEEVFLRLTNEREDMPV